MLRLLVLLLICLVSPLRALTLTPLVEGLNHPWGLALLPEGGYLIGERPGRLLRIDAGGERHVISGLPPIANQGQGGLLDLALDHEGWVYLSYSEPGDGGAGTAVARARLQKDALVDWQLLFRQQPKVAGGAHFGSRLVLTDDGYLFITLGDRYSERARAQTLDNHLGKTVRLHKDGRVPADNPFVKTAGVLPEIWSLGHRNMQGAALRPVSQQFWAHEHGPQGGDEVNLILPGHNYGWPVVTFGEEYGGGKIGVGQSAPGMTPPLWVWVPSIAPSGMTFYQGALFKEWQGDLLVGALRGQALLRLRLAGDKIISEERLLTDLGERIRTIREGADGALYLLTDSGKGRLLKLTP
ncbi:PQQ-dependent sugar dehydrogenase [Aeromonas media]|uniref:PQQ-dependent sugar dehydrogenase n=1 Tax=Aeromonas media TaxID=651 RepID=UPI00143DF51E|nr:PQQ-dependent sugar dehydrogenase [Aeromonas media]MBS4700810.1 PQQ-dependent sugar dehydrogenase [Aeromonas media]QIY87354.1 PQQ-dependent sugar dehydrogenase [Aeromonas hydrophila]